MEKILDVGEQNAFLLREVVRKQDKFETRVEEKLDEISNLIGNLKEEKIALDNIKGKGKNKSPDVFHNVCLFFLLFRCSLFIFKHN